MKVREVWDAASASLGCFISDDLVGDTRNCCETLRELVLRVALIANGHICISDVLPPLMSNTVPRAKYYGDVHEDHISIETCQ